MHILPTTSATLDDLAEPVDLRQSPADVVALSFTDSDLAAIAAAWNRGQAALPSMRLAALRDLRHPMSVDIWLEKVAAHAKVILVRILGGYDWWRYGCDQLAALARGKGIRLALLPGECREQDERLVECSTLARGELNALLAFFREGGPGNMDGLARRLAALARGEAAANASVPVPKAGFYERGSDLGLAKNESPLSGLLHKPPRPLRERGRGPSGPAGVSSPPESGGEVASQRPERGPNGHPVNPSSEPCPRREEKAPLVPILFYRSMLLADDVAPIDALCEALKAKGIVPVPIFVASLKDAESAAFVEAAIRDLAPAAIITATAFATGAEPGADTLFDRAAVPVFQVIVATTRREVWAKNMRGLAPADLAMHVVMPELDGRILAGALSFKAESAIDQALGFTALANTPEPDRVGQVAARIAAFLKLTQTRREARRLAILIPDYPSAPGPDRLCGGARRAGKRSCHAARPEGGRLQR